MNKHKAVIALLEAYEESLIAYNVAEQASMEAGRGVIQASKAFKEQEGKLIRLVGHFSGCPYPHGVMHNGIVYEFVDGGDSDDYICRSKWNPEDLPTNLDGV